MGVWTTNVSPGAEVSILVMEAEPQEIQEIQTRTRLGWKYRYRTGARLRQIF